MSSNNAIVIVDEGDGAYTVWYDSCVDNPFPSAASPQGHYGSLAEAIAGADEIGYTEYGISHMSGPVYCSQISEDQPRWCCGLLFGHDGDCEYTFNWWPERERSPWECERCSDEFTAVSHGASRPCTKDPAYVLNILVAHLSGGNAHGYVNWVAVANGVLHALGWAAGQTVTINEMGEVSHG